MPDSKTYDARRKADRVAMGIELEAAVLRADPDAIVKRYADGEWAAHERCTMVEIRGARGLCVNVDFCAEIPDIWLLSWHIATDSDARFSDSFGDVNPHHWRKATDCPASFQQLLNRVETRLIQAKCGTAFCPEREAIVIERNGCTAAESCAQFAIWADEFVAQCKAKEASA